MDVCFLIEWKKSRLMLFAILIRRILKFSNIGSIFIELNGFEELGKVRGLNGGILKRENFSFAFLIPNMEQHV